MKPIWKNGQLSVELHKPEIAALEKVRDIGRQLDAMHQAKGKALVEAVDALLDPPQPEFEA